MKGTQRKKWTHDEAVLALGLYFQMPFAKIRSSAPEIVKLARLMGRSSASLSMKMDNFGRLDRKIRSFLGREGNIGIEEWFQA